MRKFFKVELTDIKINQVIEELVRQKKLIAVEYSLDYTSVRTFYLPAKTSLVIRGQEEGTHRI